MLQNRVDPFGNIIWSTARGSLMGNRGVIHNDNKQIISAFRHKAWITCLLEFKGRKRTVMTPNRWTELFFLDEATAFAAGHRPCFECRREDANRFKSFWIQGNPLFGFSMKTSIKEIDDVIHSERIDIQNKKVVHQRVVSEIPDGVFVLVDDDPYVVRNGNLHRWTPFGYEDIVDLPKDSALTVLTPISVANAFRAGYVPHIAGDFRNSRTKINMN